MSGRPAKTSVLEDENSGGAKRFRGPAMQRRTCFTRKPCRRNVGSYLSSIPLRRRTPRLASGGFKRQLSIDGRNAGS